MIRNDKYNSKSKWYWKKNPYHLDAIELYWGLTDKEHKKLCNGVGSKVGWIARLFYHLIPNTCWFLNITSVSDIHDVDYNLPKKFKSIEKAIQHKCKADKRFRDNAFKLIDQKTKNIWLNTIRKTRILKYYAVLVECGLDSFMDGKTIDKTMGD